MKSGIATLVLLMFECVLTGAASGQVTKNGHVAMYILPQAHGGGGIDYANAKPLPLPLAAIRPISQAQAIRTAPDPLMLFGAPQVSPGSEGSGKEASIQLTPPKQLHRQDGAPPEFGTASLPYTTSRVNAIDHLTVKFSPFRASGKLFFKNGAELLFCSASLIKRGLVVTAAHCVARYGKYYYDHFEFVPAYDNGTAPFDRWSFVVVAVPQAYFDGNDGCAEAGVICPDDVAILTVRPHGSVFPGDFDRMVCLCAQRLWVHRLGPGADQRAGLSHPARRWRTDGANRFTRVHCARVVEKHSHRIADDRRVRRWTVAGEPRGGPAPFLRLPPRPGCGPQCGGRRHELDNAR